MRRGVGGDRKAPDSPPQRRNLLQQKRPASGKQSVSHTGRSRPSGATICEWSNVQRGALLRERKVTGRDASLPAPLLSAFGILVARGTVGALPQTPQGTLSLDPARGKRKGTKSPLDPFSRLSWSLFLTSSACCSDVPPIHPHTKPRGLRFSHRPRGSVYPITSAYKVRHSHSRRWSAYRPASHPRQ